MVIKERLKERLKELIIRYNNQEITADEITELLSFLNELVKVSLMQDNIEKALLSSIAINLIHKGKRIE